MSVQRTSQVMVVGAGLVGLSTAIALRAQGIDVRVIERHLGTSSQPKARRLNFRSMEVFRSLGVAEAVAEAARGLADHQGMRAGRTLAEAELLPAPPGVDYGELANISSEQSCLVAQDVLEPVLLRIARERGATVDFDTELVGLSQDASGVTVDTADGDSHRASYVVAADGSRSTVRELLDITRSGTGVLNRAITVYFDADLTELIHGREFNLCQVERDGVAGAFASIDGARRWLFYTGELLPVDAPEQAWAALLRLAIGVDDVDIRIRSVQAWEPAMLVADRFVDGRVLLAGDAAHVMPPFAALGANTGIQDAANLAWKLALALRGEAGPALVSTYHEERHPAGWFAADQSSRRTGGLRELVAGTPELAHPFALVAGYQYRSGAMIDDGTDPQPMDRLVLTGRPGTRVPHAWLPDRRSTLDVAGPGFAVLTGPGGADWVVAAKALGLAVAQVPSERDRPDHPDQPDHSGQPDFPVDSGALLVRPDGIVAWATPGSPDSGRTLGEVLATVCRR